MSVGQAVVESITVAYGCVLLLVACGYALIQKETWVGASASERAQLAAASKKFWSLKVENPHWSHEFLSLTNGLQLHYLKSRSKLRNRPAKHLVIFLHGFPDSCHLFRRVLESDLVNDAQLISLDLPGCGGSDSLPVYSADAVLNAVVEALVILRKHYLTAPGAKCVLVGHDWGAVIGYRIAADTRDLFDIMITMNSVHAVSLAADVRFRFTRAASLWSSWTPPFGAIFAEIGPVFNQLRKSNYTWLLQLTFPWPRVLPSVVAALLRYVHRSGSHKNMAVPEESFAMCLSSSYGPSAAEIDGTTTHYGQTYGASVKERSQLSLPGDWHSRFRLYRDGLILDSWTLAVAHKAHAPIVPADLSKPSSQGSSPGSRRLQVDAAERFKYPVVVLFGIDDEALDHRIVVDSLDDFYMRPDDGPNYRESKVKKLPDCGHWSPMTEIGTSALLDELKALVRGP